MNAILIPNRIVVRGAGEMASGVIHCLHGAGYEVIALEKNAPECVRRPVCFAEAVYEQQVTVENVTAKLVESLEELRQVLNQGKVPVLIDQEGKQLSALQPAALIDARMLKRANDCTADLAPIVIGLGPGFRAPENCHAVIETNRGISLGAVIYNGSAEADTGIPSPVGGVTSDRVLRAPCAGIISSRKTIGEKIRAGEIIAVVSTATVKAKIGGLLRGLIRDGSPVRKGQKVGDIDPIGDSRTCFAISDKARAIGQATIEALKALQSDRLQS